MSKLLALLRFPYNYFLYLVTCVKTSRLLQYAGRKYEDYRDKRDGIESYDVSHLELKSRDRKRIAKLNENLRLELIRQERTRNEYIGIESYEFDPKSLTK